MVTMKMFLTLGIVMPEISHYNVCQEIVIYSIQSKLHKSDIIAVSQWRQISIFSSGGAVMLE